MAHKECDYCNMADESEKRLFGDDIHINGGKKMTDVITKEELIESIMNAEKEVYSQIEYLKKEKVHRLRVWYIGIESLDVEIKYCPFCGCKL